MTIATVQPLHVGNALRLFIEPPPGAVWWRVLRKGNGTFTGPDDAGALVAYEGDERVVIDSESLQNEVMAFYCPYYTTDQVVWTAGPVASGTPRADYQDHDTDVMKHLRDRLETGLKVECDRGSFSTELGYIQVYSAPPAVERDLRFPLVTLHLDLEDSNERAIGESISGDEFDSIGFEWEESEGWLATVNVEIIGWSENSEERAELRRAIRRLIVGNLPVFAEYGWVQVSLSQSDVDAINGEYNMNLYQTMGKFSCLAPVRVSGRELAVRDITTRSINP